MPELPEVETVRRGLAPVLEGARIAAVHLGRPALRYPFPEGFAERLAGRRVITLGRRSKYLLWEIEDGASLLCHLGMSGSFRIEGGEAASVPGAFALARSRDSRHDHVRFEMESGVQVIYNDPRRFGFMDLVPADGLASYPLFAHLGIEPLGNELSGPWLAAAFKGKRTPLKAALLDQRIIAGLGNIYVAEALWRAGLSPERLAGTLAEPGMAAKADRLAVAIREVLTEAIAVGGSTLRDHAQADGTLGYFQHSFRVYDRAGEPCRTPGCAGVIHRTVQSGRSSFWCASCQT